MSLKTHKPSAGLPERLREAVKEESSQASSEQFRPPGSGSSTARTEQDAAALRQGTDTKQSPTCPYHNAFLQMLPSSYRHNQGLIPMDRFLAEGPSEQSALHIRADTGTLSTSRECTCYTRMAAESPRKY